MNPVVQLAATRPFAALALGYTPFLLLASTLVVLQSGLNTALVVLGANSALALVPVGCVWIGHRLTRRPGRAWWAERLVGITAGLAVLFPVVFAAAWAYQSLYPTLAESDAPLWQGWLLFAVVLTVVNVPPLVLGAAFEGVARRLARPATLA